MVCNADGGYLKEKENKGDSTVERVIKAASSFHCPMLKETQQALFKIQKHIFKSGIFVYAVLIIFLVTS